MILLSFFSEDNVLSDDIKIFSNIKVTKIKHSSFGGTPVYSISKNKITLAPFQPSYPFIVPFSNIYWKLPSKANIFSSLWDCRPGKVALELPEILCSGLVNKMSTMPFPLRAKIEKKMWATGILNIIMKCKQKLNSTKRVSFNFLSVLTSSIMLLIKD